MRIDIGCGKNKKEGFIGIDINKHDGVDYVCNIDNEKLPFENNSVDEIYSHMTLEHCSNIIHVMNEMHRVCKNNALIYIIVPYGTSHQFCQDPTHKTPFNEDTFRKYFIKQDYVLAFANYGINGFFKEEEIYIYGKDILHLQLHAKIRVYKNKDEVI